MVSNRGYIFFWGCTIPGRLPFLEKSLRIVLEKLNLEYSEIDGFTCCPEKFLIETMSEEMWYLAAARNLALAEREGKDLLVACNGCYSTFLTAMSRFNTSSRLRQQVKEYLDSIGLEYDFRSTAHHIVEVLHDDMGPESLSKKISEPMNGMNVAVHYGCQLVRPSPAARIDDPVRPQKLDSLVECLGVINMDYISKQMCCGETLGRSGFANDSMVAARLKLTELQQLEADTLVVVCPACFQQFDSQQYLLNKEGEEIDIPIFFYTELLGLALGISPEDMGLDMHRSPLDKFFRRWDEERRRRSAVPEGFEAGEIEECIRCGSCTYDCPVTQVESDFAPHELLQMILDGRLEDLLVSEDIWMCMECGTCRELCPNNVGMMKTFKKVKNMAMARGIMPVEAKRGLEMFEKTAILGKTRESARKKLGLGPVSSPGTEQFLELIRKVGEKEE